MNPDWNSLKHEYVTSKISQKKLAEKHGIPYRTIQVAAVEDKWFTARKKYNEQVVKKAIKKSAEKESSALAEIAKLKSETALLLWKATRKVAAKLEDNEELDTSDLRKVTQCYVDLAQLPMESEASEDAHNALVAAIMGIEDDDED